MGTVTEAAPHPRVTAALAAAGVSYVVRRHADCALPIHGPVDFARALDRPVDAITKALFLEVTGTGVPVSFAIAVCSVSRRVDFAVLARHWNATHVRLAARAELASQLEYPPTGVAPFGGDNVRVAIDEGVFAFGTVLVGAGVVGVEIELAPADLQRASGGTRLAFAHT